MGDKTTISWAATVHPDGTTTPGHSWNPWVGCHRVSAGCLNCYMYAGMQRFHRNPGTITRSADATFENQAMADERIPLLLQAPAKVRFVSIEPMLGPVDLKELSWVSLRQRIHGVWPAYHHIQAGPGIYPAHQNPYGAVSAFLPEGGQLGVYPAEMDWCRKPDWVICGGESGPQRRPFDVAWARSLRDQCQAAGVPFFGKQIGAFRPGAPLLLDGREYREWPR